jgi:hypothetical protein
MLRSPGKEQQITNLLFLARDLSGFPLGLSLTLLQIGDFKSNPYILQNLRMDGSKQKMKTVKSVDWK